MWRGKGGAAERLRSPATVPQVCQECAMLAHQPLDTPAVKVKWLPQKLFLRASDEVARASRLRVPRASRPEPELGQCPLNSPAEANPLCRTGLSAIAPCVGGSHAKAGGFGGSREFPVED